eukprot:TRINITY_DN503_c0_g1_i3.p1 TRINITY_DN503_c0_g1~~TRINITY_DN503_c0_g1_i3.p1  ORF type:complete len:206 (-),score=26.48 TRINITY_DN503_c0_g1_i3:47-664(-)
MRVFESELLERFTMCEWYIIPLVWWPVAAFLLWLSMTEYEHSAWSALRLVVAGWPLWELFEYMLHRYVFHFKVGASWQCQLHFLLHGIHHLLPNDKRRLVFPPIPAAVLAIIVYSALRLVASPATTVPIMAGVILSYTAYDISHWYIHHSNPAPGTYFAMLKRHHFAHHFKDQYSNLGLTSPLFDFLFATKLPDTPLSHSSAKST